MYKQIKKKRTIAILVTILCACVGLGYELNYLMERGDFPRDYPAYVNNPDDSAKYEIAPETILSSLEQGETDVFSSIDTISEDYTPLVAGSFPWTQSDYLKIASALGRIEMNENLNDWHVLGMSFKKECSSSSLQGFDSGSIIYFKTAIDNGTPDYLHYQTKTIAIYPLFETVDIEGDNFPRPLFGWKSVNLNAFKITADDALKIAEENGGENVRLKTNNKCHIDIYISPVDGNKYYKVIYSGWLVIHIDPYSGEYKIIKKNDKLK